jgi:hypothetical protein
MLFGVLLLASTAFTFIPSEAGAAVPQLINFQGLLKDGSGNPVADGSYSVTFTIYDAASGGSNLWTEIQSVSTSGGLFAVLLGAINPIPDSAFKGADRWLGIAVSPDPEMPRQRLVSVGYAYRVNSVDSALGGHLTGDVTVSGNVGIGTALPNERLEISGNLRLPPTTATDGIIKVGADRFIHNYGGNTFVGKNAGNLTMIGLGNTGIGLGTLLTNTTGSRNTAIGSAALDLNTTGNDNTAIGFNALAMNSTGRENTAVGYQTLFWNTTGNSNSAHGFRALWDNTSGDSNTANGHFALLQNTTGRRNTATGVAALQYNTTGNINTAYGHRALYSNINGTYNTATGADALHSNTTGYDNTANGFWSLYDNTTGIGNTAYGAYALAVNTTGNYNTALGYQAYTTSDNLENATAIGYGAIVDASNKIRLGNAQVTVLECQVGLTVVSDRNQKENFRPVDGEKVLRKIRGFELTSWNYKGHDPKQFRHYGPTAQEFFAAFGEDGVGKIGTETTLNSGDVAGILMVAVQSLEKRTAEVADLKTRMDLLEEKLKEIQAGNPQAKVR